MLKIRVRDIPPEGLDIIEKMAAEDVGIFKEDAVQLAAPIEIKAKLEKVGNTILAKTELKGSFSTLCARCLEPVEKKAFKSFIVDFPFDKNTEHIDLGEDIRQEVVLDIPSRLLCKEDCKGICFGCGVNLNTGKCKCKNSSK